MKEAQLLIETIENKYLWEKEVVINRNEYLKVKGSIDTNLYFIEEGSLRIYHIDEYEEHTIRFGYQNNFIVLSQNNLLIIIFRHLKRRS